MILDHVTNNNVSVFFVTETWLSEMHNHTTATVKSYGYKIYHCYRDNFQCGGGVAIIYRPLLKVIKVFVNHSKSFESVSVKLKMSDNTYLFCSCIYRTGPLGSFMNDFDEYLSHVFVRFDKLIICGDFNLHIDSDNTNSRELIKITSSYGLTQLVDKITHQDGHIIDLLFASHKMIKDDFVNVDSLSQSLFPTCDHYPINFKLSGTASPHNDRKEILFRNIKNIDHACFKQDISYALAKNHNSSNFQNAIDHFNQSCINILDVHAPQLSKSIRDVPNAQWFDAEYVKLRKRRRKAEKLWKKSKLEADRVNFLAIRKSCDDLAKQKKITFFRSRFEKFNYSQKSLFQFVDTFLDKPSDIVIPPNESLQKIVDEFNNYFYNKIVDIRKNFPSCDHPPPQSTNFNGHNSTLTNFDLTTIEELKEIIKHSSVKTSSNDPLPASLIEENIDFFLPYVCDLVNLSLTSGSIDGTKLAHLSPLIKGLILDNSKLKNYRPISNLAFIAKLIERVVHIRLNNHMIANNLNIPYQLAYKKFHSTETLLIRIVNDVLIACDEKKATVLMMLDLSAAFDTVDHNRLLDILQREIGIEGTALNWFRSYLSGRCQKVKIGKYESYEIIIRFGVPQGSVLGPVLFNIYIRSIYNTIMNKKFNVHGFADDHQVYKSFKKASEYNVLVRELPQVFNDITKWMAYYYLLINPGKTEIIIFGPSAVLKELSIHGAFISSSICIRFVSTVKNLGFHLKIR